MYRRILVPVHGGPLDKSAIDLAARIIQPKNQSDLTLVYVVEVPQRFALDADLPCDIETGESVLRDAADYAQASASGNWRNIETELLQARSAGSAIVDEAIERGSDVVVLAAANRRRRGTLTQGETVPYVISNAPCSVLLVRPTTLDRGIA